jgi:hypothetical protein
MMHNALDTAHGVVEIMCIGDRVDGMLKGNSSTTESLFIHLSNDYVTKNLQSIGISLGNSYDQITL